MIVLGSQGAPHPLRFGRSVLLLRYFEGFTSPEVAAKSCSDASCFGRSLRVASAPPWTGLFDFGRTAFSFDRPVGPMSRRFPFVPCFHAVRGARSFLAFLPLCRGCIGLDPVEHGTNVRLQDQAGQQFAHAAPAREVI